MCVAHAQTYDMTVPYNVLRIKKFTIQHLLQFPAQLEVVPTTLVYRELRQLKT